MAAIDKSGLDPHERDLLNRMENLSRRYDLSAVFSDFLYLTVCAFAMKQMEKQYKEVIKRYDEESQKEFPKMLGDLMLHYNTVETWSDPLGKIYERISGSYKRSNFAQFFTPESLCEATARMILMRDPERENKERLTVLDPACGSGRLLLAFHSLDKYAHKYYGIDLDHVCALMSTINLLFHGMEGYIVHGNTISMDIFKGYHVNALFRYLNYPHIRLMNDREARAILMESKSAKDKASKEPEQQENAPQLLLNF